MTELIYSAAKQMWFIDWIYNLVATTSTELNKVYVEMYVNHNEINVALIEKNTETTEMMMPCI